MLVQAIETYKGSGWIRVASIIFGEKELFTHLKGGWVTGCKAVLGILENRRPLFPPRCRAPDHSTHSLVSIQTTCRSSFVISSITLLKICITNIECPSIHTTGSLMAAVICSTFMTRGQFLGYLSRIVQFHGLTLNDLAHISFRDDERHM
jgi:hypothetical protein